MQKTHQLNFLLSVLCGLCMETLNKSVMNQCTEEDSQGDLKSSCILENIKKPLGIFMVTFTYERLCLLRRTYEVFASKYGTLSKLDFKIVPRG